MPSRLEQFGLTLIADGVPQTWLAGIARPFLAACSRLYEIGLELYLLAEKVGLRRRERLPVPVVSIGNLTVGGTGKTPMTQFLCQLLAGQGIRAAVLSRGHGGKGIGARVVSDPHGMVMNDAAFAGDEPILLARTLPGVPVLIGKDRRVTGREALRLFQPEVLVLDDGFQYWQLARNLDIVLVDGRRPFDNGYSLPRGLLREPKHHLARAAVVVVTRADALDTRERGLLHSQIGQMAPQADVYFSRHMALGFVPVGDLTAPLQPLELLQGKNIVALSGIAQPQSFARTLREAAGANVTRHLAFSDHARYGVAEVDIALEAMRTGNAGALVMTEKDAVKWPESSRTDFPVYALRVQMHLENEAGFQEAVMRRLFLKH